MTQTRVGLVPLVLLSFFAAASPASADDSRIIRGTIFQVADSTGILSAEGTSGVKIDATFNGSYQGLAWDYVCPYTTCLPGDVVSLRSAYGTFLGSSGQLKFHGQTYDLWFPDGLSASLVFDGVLVLPEFPDSFGGTEVSVPFTFSGSIQIPNEQVPGTFDVLELHGSGVATAGLYRSPFNIEMGWVVGSVRYDFVPRPTDIPR